MASGVRVRVRRLSRDLNLPLWGILLKNVYRKIVRIFKIFSTG